MTEFETSTQDVTTDEVLNAKAGIIERCVERARQECQQRPSVFRSISDRRAYAGMLCNLGTPNASRLQWPSRHRENHCYLTALKRLTSKLSRCSRSLKVSVFRLLFMG